MSHVVLAEVKAKPPALPRGELSAGLQTAAGSGGAAPRPQGDKLPSGEAKEGAVLWANYHSIGILVG